MIKLTKNRKILYSMFIAVFFALTVLPSFAKPVDAQTSLMEPSVEMKIYQSYKFLEECANRNWKERTSSQRYLQSGDLNDGSVFNTGYEYDVGYLVDPGDTNGKFLCNDGGNVRSALNAVDITGVELFSETGIYRNGENGYELALGGNGERAARLTERIRTKYPQINFGDRASHQAQYFNLAAAFDKHCVTWDANGGNEVSWVNADGTVSTRKYFSRDTGNDGFSVGFGMDEDGGNDGEMQCSTIRNQLNTYAAAAGSSQKAFVDDGGIPTTGDASGENSDDSCESKGGAMGWILCPVVFMIGGATSWLDTHIQNILEVDETTYTNPKLKDSWRVIRNIAYSILIPIMLIMVIGTALGFEVFSAYTVKKALPRLVIAVIFITFSWNIVQLLVGMSNVAGSGVMGIMTAPFGDGANNLELTTLFSASTDNLGDLASTAASSTIQRGAIAGTMVATALFVGLGGGEAIAIIIMFLATALLFLLTAFIILVLRELFILALMLAAPVAILAWIFPGNDKLWKSWWGLFSKLLLMFPLIMAVIAMGKISAYILSTTGGGGAEAPFNQILTLVVYIVPYFFIPFTFKFAGGMFATITGAINDRERGLFDRLRKGRQKNLESMHEGAMKGTNRMGKSGIGGIYRRAGSLGRDGSWGLTKDGRSKWHEANQRRIEKVGDEMLEAGGNRAFNDDDASKLLRDASMTKDKFISSYADTMVSQGRASTQAEGQELARRALYRAEQAVGAKVGSGTMAVAAQKFRTAMTNSAFDPGEAGIGELQSELMDLQNRGLVTAADAAGWMKANKGRSDFSTNSFSDTIAFAQGHKVEKVKQADGSEVTTTTAVSARDQIAGAFRGADPRDVVGAHQSALKSFGEQADLNLQEALRVGDQALIDKAMADVANIYDSISNVSHKKGEEFADTVLSKPTGITLTRAALGADGRVLKDATGNVVEEQYVASTRQYIDYLRNNERDHTGFHDRRREYGSARDAHSAAAAADAMADPNAS